MANSNSHSSQTGCGCTTIGIVLAVVLSYSLNHSIPWAILHGLLSWFYVIYYAIVH